MQRITWIKIALWIACLLPVSILVWQFFTDRLGANPFDELNDRLGEWALRLLLITLLMTPLRHILGHSWPIKVRRLLGLFCFFYAFLHVLAYLIFEQFFDWEEIWIDILDRPFITIGMACFVGLSILAATSNRKMQRKLGRKWLKLHQSVYLIAIFAILHFYWLVKADLRTPSIYALILSSLLLFRLVRWIQKRKKVAE